MGETRRPAETLVASFRYRWRFNPQVIALMLAAFLAWFPLTRMVASGIHVVWSDTFAPTPYTMEEARPNDGSPYITGTLPSGETVSLSARADATPGAFKVGDAGNETFAPGKVIDLWWSPSAPDLSIQGLRTNAIPVASMAKRPGLVDLAGHALWFAAVLVIGARVFAWSARWARAGQGEGRIDG